MSEPLVSVIVPNYNYGHFLRETIESALAQSYQNREIIVVDDGSKDNSDEVIKSFGDQIKPVFKENGGMSSALNAGLKVSRGEWIALLDADDLWLPDKLEKVMSRAKANPNATLIYHKMRWVKEGKVFGQPWPYVAQQGHIADRVINSGGWWRHPPTT
ncbi:MAG: glycosyltransferase family 2 protein, partial [Pyrinomonadaceae bacterium]